MFRADFDFKNRWLIRDFVEMGNRIYMVSTVDLGLEDTYSYQTMVFKLNQEGDVIARSLLSMLYETKEKAEHRHKDISKNITNYLKDVVLIH